jgi:CheY-like chemotaxis protein/anti-sigma regulatory factor (Ser/Thr protein kinase)
MKKILVIDDAEFILESTSTLLSFEGYDVVTAPDGEEGVKVALQERPDLILCDIQMPKLDGYGVIDSIRLNELTQSTPFIFLTAYTEKQNMRMGMEKGADDFLVKPFTRDELLAAIDSQWKKYNIVEKKIQTKVEEVGKNLNYALPHEFKTVINQVKGSAKILADSHQDFNNEEIVELTDDIKKSCDRLLNITENFLVYVKLESYMNNPQLRSSLRKMNTDEPGALFYDIASPVSMRFERYEDLKVGDIPDEIWAEISTESFHKLMTELIDNAFKFSEKGTDVTVDMSFDGKTLTTKIKDQGRGMTIDQVKNIGAYVQFEREQHEQQGIGLGLVIAQRIVQLHDGAFDIKSEENVGTEITFTLHCHKYE